VLRARHQRPRCYAAERRDQFAADSFDDLVGERKQRRRHLEA